MANHAWYLTHPLYYQWADIKQRCFNTKDNAFHNYGGRGIVMCDPWRRSYAVFEANVVTEIGPRPSRAHSLDRIDNNGDYRPGNIRWGTPAVQTRNGRRTKLTIEDARLIRQLFIKGTRWNPGNAVDLAARFGVDPKTIRKITSGERWRE